MVKKLNILFIFVMLFSFLFPLLVFAKDIPFTQEDRDRLIRLEVKVEQIDKRFDQIDKRFEQADKRFEQIDKRFEQADKRGDSIERRLERLEGVMMWGFGLLFTTMIGLVGFVLWDRRTALAPAIRKNKELEEREEKLEKALKEIAVKDPNVAEALKHVGIL